MTQKCPSLQWIDSMTWTTHIMAATTRKKAAAFMIWRWISSKLPEWMSEPMR